MNKKFKAFVLTICMFSIVTCLKAQGTPDEIISDFFELYKQSPLVAVSKLIKSNQWVRDKNQYETDNLLNKLASTIEHLGDYHDYEKLAKKSVGKSFLLHSYLVKYDRQPIRFIIMFYKPKNHWKVSNFVFESSLWSEMEEMAKMYRLKDTGT